MFEVFFSHRRKLTSKLQETEEAYNTAAQKASSTEKARKRMEGELEDALIDLEKVRCMLLCCRESGKRRGCARF